MTAERSPAGGQADALPLQIKLFAHESIIDLEAQVNAFLRELQDAGADVIATQFAAPRIVGESNAMAVMVTYRFARERHRP